MNNDTKKISDLFDALPPAVQMVVYDGPLDKELEDIGVTYHISAADLEKIKSEVLLIIIGADKPETLEQNILLVAAIDKLNIKKICEEIAQKIILPLAAEHAPAEEVHPDKETILNDIENPVPAKNFAPNPAGKNPILDAQHNLPEGERKTLISSGAVPSRGPLLNNVNTGYATIPKTMPPIPANLPTGEPMIKTFIVPVQPIQPKQETPVTIPPKPVVPAPTPATYPFSQPQQPQQAPVQVPKAPSVPIPPAPEKYTVDPYREPAE